MRTMIQTTALCMLAGSVLAQTPAPIPIACPAVALPIPSGPNERPGEKLNQPKTPEEYGIEQDYRWIHSSTNLQGNAATEKFAPCLFYNPRDHDLFTQLNGFQSAFVINNPTGNGPANVRVQLYNRNGVLFPRKINDPRR